MKTKSAKTKQYIIESTSILFNKNGYHGTSLSDITKATGLTKGAIYGNFQDKEALAIDVFNYNVRKYIGYLTPHLEQIESPLAKLFGITNFYRSTYHKVIEAGGCPLLNLSVDTNNTNNKLFNRAKEVIFKLQKRIANTINKGIEKGEMKEEIDADKYAGLMFSLIEGGIFTSTITNDESYIVNMMNHLDSIIINEIKK